LALPLCLGQSQVYDGHPGMFVEKWPVLLNRRSSFYRISFPTFPPENSLIRGRASHGYNPQAFVVLVESKWNLWKFFTP
jgi:hypothetical protein